MAVDAKAYCDRKHVLMRQIRSIGSNLTVANGRNGSGELDPDPSEELDPDLGPALGPDAFLMTDAVSSCTMRLAGLA